VDFVYHQFCIAIIGDRPIGLPGQHAHIGPMYVYCGLVGVGTTTLTPAVVHKGQLGCVWALCGVYGPALGWGGVSSRESW